MEHQSAVTYGNHFVNGYLERDWTGVGISPRFDFIIIHESGHEWFGNSVTAADVRTCGSTKAGRRISKAFTSNTCTAMMTRSNTSTATSRRCSNQAADHYCARREGEPPADQYFKGALFINTLRSVVNDDERWWTLLHEFYQQFKYQNIMTEDMVPYFNQQTGMNLTPIFDQYLRHTAIPTLELKFDKDNSSVSYRWKTDEPGFPENAGTSWEKR